MGLLQQELSWDSIKFRVGGIMYLREKHDINFKVIQGFSLHNITIFPLVDAKSHNIKGLIFFK